jgi:hypothetical protein
MLFARRDSFRKFLNHFFIEVGKPCAGLFFTLEPMESQLNSVGLSC